MAAEELAVMAAVQANRGGEAAAIAGGYHLVEAGREEPGAGRVKAMSDSERLNLP
jgi:hypothetical protein